VSRLPGMCIPLLALLCFAGLDQACLFVCQSERERQGEREGEREGESGREGP
jgi:hypothetical protein